MGKTISMLECVVEWMAVSLSRGAQPHHPRAMPRIDDGIKGEFRERLLLIQADGSQNGLPILRQAIHVSIRKHHPLVLMCTSTPASYFCLKGVDSAIVVDRTSCIPGYDDGWADPGASLLDAIKTVPYGPLTVVIESVDTIAQDVGSSAKCYKLLDVILALLIMRPSPSRLILSLPSESPLLPLLVPPSFSASLTHLVLHSPLLVRHLAESFLTPPPPLSPPERFWALFGPAAGRGESERLAFSSVDGRDPWNGVVQVITRGSPAASRARAVERTLEAWVMDKSGDVRGLAWEDLPSLQDLKHRDSIRSASTGDAFDPTSSLSLPFNLSLTGAQALARAKVPLPYAHQGMPPNSSPDDGRILYEPDSADDVDDDDPDEDLDI